MSELTLASDSGSLRITEQGAVIEGEISLQQWTDSLANLRRVKNIYHRALADVVAYGRRNYGDKVVEGAMEQLQFDVSDVHRAVSIARLGNGLRAMDGLSSEHQYVLGKEIPESAEEQEKWAGVAVKEKLNPADLKLSIQLGRVTRSKDRNQGVMSFEAVTALFLRTVKQYDVKTLTKSQKKSIAGVLAPVSEFADRMKN
jgi:hypothetical protein